MSNAGPSTATGRGGPGPTARRNFIRQFVGQPGKLQLADFALERWARWPREPRPTLTLVGRVDVAGPKTNTAQVSAADQPDVDSTPGNNVPTEDDQDSVTIEAPQIDLSLTKAASPTTVVVGQNVTFTINLANAGPSTATGVTVRDQIPAGISFVSSTATQGNYDAGTGIWTVGSVATGVSPRLTLVGRVDVAGRQDEHGGSCHRRPARRG